MGSKYDSMLGLAAPKLTDEFDRNRHRLPLWDQPVKPLLQFAPLQLLLQAQQAYDGKGVADLTSDGHVYSFCQG